MKITRRMLNKASHADLSGLERLARFLGLDMPNMPRHWHGYREALVRRVDRTLNPRDDYPGERDRCSWRHIPDSDTFQIEIADAFREMCSTSLGRQTVYYFPTVGRVEGE